MRRCSINLVLARACSNSCPYCFETNERYEEKQGFISWENATRLAAWARDSGLQYLSLLGGEPFLHPELGRIVTLFRETSPATSLQILTGGIFRQSLLDGLSPDELGFIFNVNEPRDYRNPRHFEEVLRNIEAAIRRGFKVILGYNVWREDFDPGFMPALARRLGRTTFRWTVANPQWGGPSCVVKPARYQALAGRCFDMLQQAARYDIEALLDCPLPLCFFSASQLAWVRQYHAGTAARMGFCEPVLDATPELEAIRCFALSKLGRVKVTDFSSEWALLAWFKKHVDAQLLEQGCFPRCRECVHFTAGRCSGGCLAWHEGQAAAGAGAESRASRLARGMFAALEAKDPALALSQYEQASYAWKTDLPTYLAAVACAQLGQTERAFLHAARAQDMALEPDAKQRVRELLAQLAPGADGADAAAVLLPFVSLPAPVEGESEAPSA